MSDGPSVLFILHTRPLSNLLTPNPISTHSQMYDGVLDPCFYSLPCVEAANLDENWMTARIVWRVSNDGEVKR